MKIKVSNRMKVLMKKKVSRIILILVLCGVAAILVSSALRSDSATVPQYQVATVQRGNLTVDITASGNLALSKCEDLAFEMAGTVAEVAVAEGDSVKQGQVLATLDTSEWDSELLTLEYNLLQARLALGNTRAQTTDPDEIKLKKLQVELAKARLAEAEDASPEITAPFDGFVTNVNVEGGDEVTKGTVAVTLADPNKFEVDILVSEMDVSQVEVGGVATVQADAISGISLPAKVTHISPTATIQSGVVNYKVMVEVESLQPVQGSQPTQNQTSQAAPGGQGPVMQTSQAIQLREGLTVTVSIIVAQRTDVLLVPNGAITTQGGQSYVQVISSTGTTEKRAIKTGITDYVKTEVTEGLSEGEQIVVPKGTTTTTSTTPQQGPPGGISFF
jgi:HlyD family secretion protein